MRTARLTAGHWRRALADLEVARILAALGRGAEAAGLARPAADILAGRLGEADARVRDARSLTARLTPEHRPEGVARLPPGPRR